MANPVSTFPPVPTATNEQDYNTESDLFFGHFVSPFTAEMNAAILAMNLNDVSDTSTTSNIINLTPGKVFTVSSGKGFLPGAYLIIADTAAAATNSMVVQVVSYTGTTLTVTPLTVTGSGTKTAWTISFSAQPNPGIGIHKVVVHTGNGNGSVNNKIRRFTTILTNVGTTITYADSATLGSSFTINGDGFYSIQFEDIGGINSTMGISVNSSQLTTSIFGISIADRIAQQTQSGSGLFGRVSAVIRLSASDVVRPHNGSSNTSTTNGVFFSIEKVGNV